MGFFSHFSWCRISFPLVYLYSSFTCSLVAEGLKTVYHSVYIQRTVKVTTSLQVGDGCDSITVTEQ